MSDQTRTESRQTGPQDGPQQGRPGDSPHDLPKDAARQGFVVLNTPRKRAVFLTAAFGVLGVAFVVVLVWAMLLSS